MSHIGQYNRGSEWRKWDLHVHTPASYFWKGGKKLKEMTATEKEASLKTFVKTVNDSDVDAFCIMDYWTFDWCIELKKYIVKNPDELKKAVFFGMELRVECPVNYRLNIHVVLSDKLTEQELNDFKSELKIRIGERDKNLSDEALIEFAKTLGEDKARVHGYAIPSSLTEDKLLELGSKTAEVTKDSLKKAFGHIPADSGYIILPYDTSDGLLGLDWSRHPQDDNFFMQTASIFETRDQKNIDLFQGKKTEENKDFFKNFYKTIGGQPKPCVSGSDAHKFSEYGQYPSDKITWIKADPTFEGLRQIIYEPFERVKIQSGNPSFEYDKPYFAEVQIQDEVAIFQQDDDQVYFCKETLPLNKNLVAIIGGRGTGKSMLVDYWANIFDRQHDYYTNDGNFAVEYAKDNVLEPTKETYKGNNDNYLDFIYIPQSQLKKVSEKENIEPEVKKLLELEDLYFSQDLNEEIQTTLDKINKLQGWFTEEDEEGRQLNQQKNVEALRTENEELLKSITTKKNKEKLEKYTKNIGKIQELKNNLEYLNELKEQLEQTQESLNESVDEINERLPQKDGFKEIKQVDFKIQLDDISANEKILETQKKSKETENQNIREDFGKEGFTGDLSSLLKNAGTYQSQIKWADKQLVAIGKKKTELTQALQKRDNLAAKLKSEYESQKAEIDQAWEGILEKHEGVHKELIKRILLKDGKTSVEGEIVFNKKKFYEKLFEITDKRTCRNIDILQKSIGISNFEDWVQFVGTKLKNFIDEKETIRFVEPVENIFFGIKERGEYLKTLPKITYDGRKLKRLSVGQRGTVYLCLKLATDAFSKPIVFDQPEDDLDNKFIVNELIDIFRELKQYRQIIIVTHNANLVVNADAEQVIVAKNENEKLSYESGSLENVGIISSVCEILEGGEEAFEKRKHKYHI